MQVRMHPVLLSLMHLINIFIEKFRSINFGHKNDHLNSCKKSEKSNELILRKWCYTKTDTWTDGGPEKLKGN